jgi:glucose/arabinose dehydrogenase
VADRARPSRRRRDQHSAGRQELRLATGELGDHYSGAPIPKPSTRPDLADAAYQWTPVIGASGLAFYTGELFSGWRGNLLAGGLVSRAISRLTLDGQRVTGEERIRLGARIRDVRQGPGGAIYALTDEGNGKILRLTPAR